MKVSLVFEDKKLVFPAVNILSALSSDFPLFNQKHDLRHPLGIYNVSTAHCLKRLKAAITAIKDPNLSVILYGKTSDDASFTDTYDGFLDAMMEHLDDCLQVLLCFFPSSKVRDSHSVVKKYRATISDYRNHIGALVNHIKHAHGRIQLVSIKNATNFVAGYFVEGVDSDGAIGPAKQVHQPNNQAFSFNRDLRLHFVNFLLISDALRAALSELIEVRETAEGEALGSEFLASMALDVESLPKVVFAHEMNLDWPRLAVVPDAVTSQKVLKVEYPCNYERLSTLRGRFEVVSRFTGDGVSKSFRFPI